MLSALLSSERWLYSWEGVRYERVPTSLPCALSAAGYSFATVQRREKVLVRRKEQWTSTSLR